MNAVDLLEKYFGSSPTAFGIVLEHSRMVSIKALRIAESLNGLAVDLQFVEEAALLHDIGVSRIHAPDMGCFGQEPYIRHGIIGRKILEEEGYPRHALVCERHIGVGLTVDDIR
ncbi:MAG TPA: HDIG domain-containing protein, partial [Geobacteraceae bacterium]|nr:HDIG domain-containing protein [Geobacteraceae bacterium]